MDNYHKQRQQDILLRALFLPEDCLSTSGSVQAPDFLSRLSCDIIPALDALGSAVNAATNGLGCPRLNEINKSQFAKYPGYTNLKTGGTY